MATIGTVEGILRLRDEFTSTLTRASTQLEQTGRKMQRVGRQMQTTGARLTAGVTLPLAAIGAAAVKMSADAEEAANKFNVVMGESADDVRERFLELRDTLPLTLDEMERLSAGVQDLLVPFGVAREEAAQMSANMVELAGDVASFNNVSPERVLDAISSALAGSSEPMRRFGVDTRVARLEALALSEGLIEVGEELDSTATAQAVLIAIQRDSTDAMGDAARTVDSTANQMRFLARDVREATQTLGDALIPVARSLIGTLRPMIQSFVDLNPRMRTAIVAVGALAAAIGPLLIGLGSLIRLLGFAATGLSTFAARAATARAAVLSLNTALGAAGLAAGLGLVIAASKALERVSGDLDKAIQRDVEAANAAGIAFRVLARGEQVTAQEAAELVREFQRVNGQIAELEAELEAGSQGFKVMRGELVPVGRDSAQVEESLEMLRAKAAELREAIDEVGEFSLKTADDVGELENPAESLNEALEQLENTSTNAAAAIGALGEESRDAFRDVVDAMNELNRLTEQGEQQIRDTLAAANEGTIEWSDSLGTVEEILDRLRQELDLTVPEIEEQNQAVADQAAEWIQVGQAAAQAFREIDDDAGRVIQAIVSMTAAMIAFNQAASAAAQAVAALNIATAAFALFSIFAGGGRRTQVSGPIPIGPGGAETGDLSEEMGFAIGSVREEFGKFLDAFNAALRETMQAISLTIPETMEPVFFEFEKVFKDGQLRFVRVIVDGVTESFDTAEEAIGFALQKFLQAVVEVGAEVDEAVRQIIEGFVGDPAQFQDVLRRVQGLADQAAIALDGVSEVGLALQKLPAELQALTQELTQLGLSTDQVRRLVGGQLVQSFQTLRQQITGEQLSVARRREIARANAELFNAELELQIARLEAERDALLAEAGLSQQQVALLDAQLSAQAKGLQARGEIARGEAKLADNVIDARSKFVRASGQVFQAEANVMVGFIQAGTGIVRTGLEAVGSFVDVIGQISPEIAKQVRAIQKVIDALRKIGPIRPGDIRIPGIPGGPRGGPGPGRVPGPRGRPVDPTERLRRRISETLQSLLGLADAIGSRIEELRNSLEGLAQFRADLLTGPLSALRPAARLQEAESQFREAVLRAQEGDASAIADVQRLGQQFLQLQAEFGGTATAGFTRAFDLVRDLTEDVLTEGNELVETELENLQDINNQIADLLESNRDVAEALGFAQEDIAEIRRRGIPAEEGTRESIDELRQDQDRAFRQFSRLLENIIELLANAS